MYEEHSKSQHRTTKYDVPVNLQVGLGILHISPQYIKTNNVDENSKGPNTMVTLHKNIYSTKTKNKA